MAKKSSALKVSAKKAVTSTAKSSAKPAAKAKAKPKEIAKPAAKAKVASTPAPAAKAKGKVVESAPAKATKIAPVKEAPAAKAAASTKSGKESAKSAPTPAAKIDKSNMTEDQVRWHEMLKKYGKDQAQIYSMSGQFNASSPLMHKTLGWGYILTNDMDRLEVLFESGKKILISNYKTS